MSFYMQYPASSGGGSGSNASVGANGITAPTSSTEIGTVDASGNLQPASATNPVPVTIISDIANPQHVIVDSSALPTGASTSANQTNGSQVTQITGTVPLPTGASTSALQTSGNASLTTIATNTTGITVAQGSTTAGQTGQLELGAVTTASPTYTTGQSSALSLTTAGALRIDGSGVTQPVSIATLPIATGAATSALQTSTQGTIAAGTAATASTAVSGVFNTTLPTLTTGQGAAIQLDASGRQIVAQATASALNATVSIAAAQTLATVTTVGTVTTVSAVTSANTAKPTLVTDVASAAITTTTTTAGFTPTFGSSYMVDIPVTVVSGTTPTLSVVVQESPDNGTNWFPVYTFPTITATGSYTSPVITMTGTQVRYVQTVTGTTPSFTRAISRVQSSQASTNIPTQGILTDNSAVVTTSSTTLMAANPQRKYLLLQNPGTQTVYFNFTSAATIGSGSFQLPAGASFVQEASFVTTEAITMIASAAGIITAKQA